MSVIFKLIIRQFLICANEWKILLDYILMLSSQYELQYFQISLAGAFCFITVTQRDFHDTSSIRVKSDLVLVGIFCMIWRLCQSDKTAHSEGHWKLHYRRQINISLHFSWKGYFRVSVFWNTYSYYLQHQLRRVSEFLVFGNSMPAQLIVQKQDCRGGFWGKFVINLT